MNKETLIAIIIGVTLGLGGAVYLSNFRPSGRTQRTNQALTVSISPRVSKQSESLAVFSSLPENGSLLTKNSINFKGRADKSSRLFVANQIQITPIKVAAGSFSHDFTLKPGLNKLVLYELNGAKEQLKVLKLYYLQPVESIASNTEKEATGEAEILKQKLEAKVMELRNHPKKVLGGEIKVLGEKDITIIANSQSYKLVVEPEITNFFEVIGGKLDPIEFSDLEKGDNITAFVSDIAGDEISYTLYKEPALTIAAAKVSNIDDKAYRITLVDFDKSSFGADIEVGTKQNLYNGKNGKIEKAGFSKLVIGQRILAILSGAKDDYSVDEYLIIE